MVINTSLNIHPEIMMKINNASIKSGFTQNEIIIRLLKQAMKDVNKFYPKKPRRIKYQRRDDDAQWYTFHVTYLIYEYEYFLDIRKIYKMSVSHILAIAVKKYLKTVIFEMIRTKNSQTIDNNQLFARFFQGKLVGNVICWKSYWGIPDNLVEILSCKTL